MYSNDYLVQKQYPSQLYSIKNPILLFEIALFLDPSTANPIQKYIPSLSVTNQISESKRLTYSQDGLQPWFKVQYKSKPIHLFRSGNGDSPNHITKNLASIHFYSVA